MNWDEKLKEIYEELEAIHVSYFNSDSYITILLQHLCRFTQRNIDLFMFGVSGGNSNYSYVDVMKTAVRRQIDVNQKATLPLIRKINPINDLWKYEPSRNDFEEINNYWIKNYDFPSHVVKDIKNNASNYVHPMLPLKILEKLEGEDLAQRIYEDCGGSIDGVNYFIERLNLSLQIKASLKSRIFKLFADDVQSMIHFSDLFVKIMRSFEKDLIK